MSSLARVEGSDLAAEAPARARSLKAGFRVLVVGHSYLLRTNQQKLDALSRRCAAVGLLVPSNWKYHGGLFAGQSLAPEHGSDSFAVLEAPVVRAGHLASYLFEPVSLARAMAAFPSDIVHIDQEVYSLASAQVAMAAKAFGRKVVVFGWENLDWPVHPLQRLARKMVVSLADAIVCGNSEGVALVRQWGFGGRIEIIPQLGVDPSLFRRAERPTAGPFMIGFVGRLVKEKGVDVLLRALAALASRGRDFQGCICGAGPLAGELQELARGLGIGGRIHWTGALAPDRIPGLMRGLDVLVLPSRLAHTWKEQFGHVLIEAMAMGIPVVGSCSGAIPEVIGRDDLVFAEENAGGLACILERLMAEPNWRRQVENYAIARVRQHFTHDRIAERLTELWTEILPLNRAGRPC